MAENLYFRRQGLESLLGGKSVLDARKLSVRNLDQAQEFIQSYGYDWDDEEDQKTCQSFFRQSIAYLQDQILKEDEKVPDEIYDSEQLGDLRQLLVYSSMRNTDKPELQKWSCAILKVMHCIAHLSNDLYAPFQQDIRNQILSPIKEAVFDDAVQGAAFLQSKKSEEKIKLANFEIKPLKNQTSAVTKLLAKERLVALNILDRMGARFVTRSTFDIFRVIRFLVDNGLVSYPHSIANESANTVYPANLFLEAMDGLRSTNAMANEKEIEGVLNKKLIDHGERAEYSSKENSFTAADYKFIKFISRKLIHVTIGRGGYEEKIRFFYPFEIQIMDYETYTNNMRGPLSHEEYKKRQKRGARLRLFGPS